MPIMRVKEIRDMSTQDRQKRLRELQTELTRLRTTIKAGGAIENPSRVRQLRKTIARILTVESEPKPLKKEEKEKKAKPKKKPKQPKERKTSKEDTEGKKE